MYSKVLSAVRPLLSVRRGYASSRDRPGAGKNFLYGGVLIGAASVFGGLVYILAKDMIFQDGAYAVIDDAAAKIEANPRIVQMLGGLPLSIHGYTSNRGRRRPAIHESHMSDGARTMETSFFVEGRHATGKVSLQVVEDEEGRWKERYFAVEIPGHPLQILVQPAVGVDSHTNRWRPLARFQ